MAAGTSANAYRSRPRAVSGGRRQRKRVPIPPTGSKWRRNPRPTRTFPAHGQQVAVDASANAYRSRPRAASGGRRQRKRVPIPPTGKRETWPVARSRLRPHDSGAAGHFAPCHHARIAARSLATASSSARSSSVAHASDSARNCSRARKISRASVARRKTSDRVSPGRRSFSNREIVSSSTRKLMTAIHLFYLVWSRRPLSTGPWRHQWATRHDGRTSGALNAITRWNPGDRESSTPPSSQSTLRTGMWITDLDLEKPRRVGT